MGWLALCVVVGLAWLQLCGGLPLDGGREHKLETWDEIVREKGAGKDLCLLCEAAVDVLKVLLETNASLDTIFPVVEPICLFFMNKTHGYYGPYMCPGIINSYGPVVLFVIAEGALDPADICYLLHLCNHSSSHPPPQLPSLLKQPWLHRQLPAAQLGGAPYHTANGGSPPAKEGKRTGGNNNTVIFLQMSDIHLDQQFSEGSPSLCNLYLCCRSWYNGTGPAGHYGDFNCDLPIVTLDLVLETITGLDPQPDFIIYTGDNSPHNPWNETWASQYQVSDFLISRLTQKLPNRRIYPAIGNHETYPESEYIGTLPQYQELNRKLAGYWASLAPLPQSALDTIADGAYYTVLVQDKLRIISFNSDYGYSINFYTRLNNNNPYYTRQQLWIMDTLEKAEQAREKVMMIAHIPPGDPGNTLQIYEEFYLNLTKRYRDTIVAHLFGHTHHDEFTLVQDEGGVYGSLMICPSVTPYGRSNPSFRVFTMDATTYQLLGYQQYHLNLSLANELATKGLKPKMELAYTTLDLYHLPDLTPSSWAGLVERFSDFPELVSEYRYNIYGRTSLHDRSCDPQCVHDTICRVSNIINAERLECTASNS